MRTFLEILNLTVLGVVDGCLVPDTCSLPSKQKKKHGRLCRADPGRVSVMTVHKLYVGVSGERRKWRKEGNGVVCPNPT